MHRANLADIVRDAEVKGLEFGRKEEALHRASCAAKDSLKSEMSEVVTKLRRKYDAKLQNARKELTERENYEQKLKSLLQMEVGNVRKLQEFQKNPRWGTL